MSRGTAMSISSSGRPPRCVHHLLELLALDDVVGGVGRGDDDVGLGQLLGQLLEADGAAAEALGEADRAVVVAVGDEDGVDAAGDQGAGDQLGGLAGADHAAPGARRGRRACAARSSTATEGIETPFSLIPVSSRARPPAARAPRKSRLRIGPVAPSTSASS